LFPSDLPLRVVAASSVVPGDAFQHLVFFAVSVRTFVTQTSWAGGNFRACYLASVQCYVTNFETLHRDM